jgi:hypothetical protein
MFFLLVLGTLLYGLFCLVGQQAKVRMARGTLE